MGSATVRQLAAGALVALGIGAAALWRAAPPERAAVEPVSTWTPATRSPAPVNPAPPSSPSPPSRAPQPVPSPATPTAPTAPPGITGAALDEAELMSRLRALARSDPEAAVALAREGNRRFPKSADAGERASLLVHALASLGRASEARGEAEDVVNDLPDSPWVREIEAFTGAHRHRNLRLAADGGLEFY